MNESGEMHLKPWQEVCFVALTCAVLIGLGLAHNFAQGVFILSIYFGETLLKLRRWEGDVTEKGE